MHITLRQLEVFAEVLKSGSTTQASVMLSLSQSAVSAALTDLEGQLGVQLFDRVGKRLVVNEHGRLLYPRALALLEQAVEIEQLFREDNGAIRVYASSTIGNYILPAMIARYRQHYPALPLELSVGNSQDVINAVLDFRVDIGLIEGPCHSTEIISEPWLEDELVVFAAPSSPLTQGAGDAGTACGIPMDFTRARFRYAGNCRLFAVVAFAALSYGDGVGEFRSDQTCGASWTGDKLFIAPGDC